MLTCYWARHRSMKSIAHAERLRDGRGRHLPSEWGHHAILLNKKDVGIKGTLLAWCEDDDHFFPATRSARVAGANVTTGTRSGTVTVLLPPLYDRLTVRPLVAVTTVSTLAFVIVLLLPKSLAKWPSLEPRAASGNTNTALSSSPKLVSS